MRSRHIIPLVLCLAVFVAGWIIAGGGVPSLGSSSGDPSTVSIATVTRQGRVVTVKGKPRLLLPATTVTTGGSVTYLPAQTIAVPGGPAATVTRTVTVTKRGQTILGTTTVPTTIIETVPTTIVVIGTTVTVPTTITATTTETTPPVTSTVTTTVTCTPGTGNGC
jgi:hypothetical protein